MLGLIHRTALGKGPEQFRQFFFPTVQRSGYRTRLAERRRLHGRQLKDPRELSHLNVVRRSTLGLVAIYNLLPAKVVKLETVKDFQSALAELLKERATQNCDDWRESF